MDEWDRGGVRMSLGRWTLVSFGRRTPPDTCHTPVALDLGLRCVATKLILDFLIHPVL